MVRQRRAGDCLGFMPPVLVLRDGVEGHFPPKGNDVLPSRLAPAHRVPQELRRDTLRGGDRCVPLPPVLRCHQRRAADHPAACWVGGGRLRPVLRAGGSVTSEEKYGTVAYRKVIPAGTVEITPPIGRPLSNMGVFVRQGSADCAGQSTQPTCECPLRVHVDGRPWPAYPWCRASPPGASHPRSPETEGGCPKPDDCPTPVPAPPCKCL